jgi:hypothetical protein
MPTEGHLMIASAPQRAPWYAYAAKFLIALGVAVVGAAATITAAVADDHVSTQEFVAIGLAVIGGLVGSGAVFAVENNYRGRRPPAGLVPAEAVDPQPWRPST